LACQNQGCLGKHNFQEHNFGSTTLAKKALAKQSQHINSKKRNIVGPTLPSFRQTTATIQHNKSQQFCARHDVCVWPPCNMFGIENRISGHAQVQPHCCANMQHSQMLNEKFDHSNLSQQHPAPRKSVLYLCFSQNSYSQLTLFGIGLELT